MRLRPILAIVVCAGLALGQKMHSVRGAAPLALPPGIRPATHVTTGEVFLKDGRMDRVFRYSYRANFTPETRRLTKLLLARGWARIKVANAYALERKATGRVVDQVLLFFPRRLIVDAKSESGDRAVTEPGWIWLSYNEYYSDRETAAQLRLEHRRSGRR